MNKYDLHLHYGGCISAPFIWSVIESKGLKYLAESFEEVESMMVFRPNEPFGFYRFLDKFKILDQIPWDIDTIVASVYDVANTINSNNLEHVWLRFSINKYLQFVKLHKWELITLISDTFKKACGNRVSLLLSLKYESTKASQRQHSQILEDERCFNSIAGMDLVGDEAQYSASFYKSICAEWLKHNKIVCAHVGESQPSDNILSAIRDIGIREIAHGIKAVNDPDIMGYARDNDVCFHMCPTSNILTGVWDQSTPHPVATFLNYGVKVTIGMDDPIQCSTNLDNEYNIIRKYITEEQHATLFKNAADRVLKYNG